MTETLTPTVDYAAIMAKHAAWEAEARKLIPKNKALLFACLASAGITYVVVTFNGEGDSGQIEEIQPRNDAGEAELPATPVQLLAACYGGQPPEVKRMPLADALEELCYDLLRDKHAGWENNDGAYGEFTFDVAAGTITLDYNERFTSSENHVHEW
ncbi:DUF6878 family protein [Sphingobium sp. B2]|uniref:DUF6878 family protein n=1 Tax=Sphingobium sp. B2 TaxID=2583228 RepID=UPI0011AAC219|nr:DUF6878 family protein [Sphingobium sp. B2]